jgi:hypothetical protein
VKIHFKGTPKKKTPREEAGIHKSSNILVTLICHLCFQGVVHVSREYALDQDISAIGSTEDRSPKLQ